MGNEFVTVDDLDAAVLYACPSISASSSISSQNVSSPSNSSSLSDLSAPLSASSVIATGWISVPISGARGDAESQTSLAACSATFSFVGSRIRVGGSVGPGFGVYTCGLDDGVKVASFNARRGAAAKNVTYCEISGLNVENHTFVLTTGPLPSWNVSLDSFTYWTNVSSGNSTFYSQNPSYFIPTPVAESAFTRNWNAFGPVTILVVLVLILVGELGLLVLAGLVKLSEPVGEAGSKGRYARTRGADDDEQSLSGKTAASTTSSKPRSTPELSSNSKPSSNSKRKPPPPPSPISSSASHSESESLTGSSRSRSSSDVPKSPSKKGRSSRGGIDAEKSLRKSGKKGTSRSSSIGGI